MKVTNTAALAAQPAVICMRPRPRQQTSAGSLSRSQRGRFTRRQEGRQAKKKTNFPECDQQRRPVWRQMTEGRVTVGSGRHQSGGVSEEGNSRNAKQNSRRPGRQKNGPCRWNMFTGFPLAFLCASLTANLHSVAVRV